jgi:hypothetical protein
MALNIKPFYPLEHPGALTLSTKDLISRISQPTSATAHLQSEDQNNDTFKNNEDLYMDRFKPKWKQENYDLNEVAIKRLEVI